MKINSRKIKEALSNIVPQFYACNGYYTYCDTIKNLQNIVSIRPTRSDFSLRVSRYEMHDKFDASNGLNGNVKNLDSFATRNDAIASLARVSK